jgi:hypothetical protein
LVPIMIQSKNINLCSRVKFMSCRDISIRLYKSTLTILISLNRSDPSIIIRQLRFEFLLSLSVVSKINNFSIVC